MIVSLVCLPCRRVEGEPQTQHLGYSKPLFREASADVLGRTAALRGSLTSTAVALELGWLSRFFCPSSVISAFYLRSFAYLTVVFRLQRWAGAVSGAHSKGMSLQLAVLINKGGSAAMHGLPAGLCLPVEGKKRKEVIAEVT